MTLLSFVIVALLSAFGISSLVEFYKKTIRKGKAGAPENWVVGGVLSVGFSVLTCIAGLSYPLFSSTLMNIALYSVLFFLIQFFLDMKVIKKILASALENTDISKLLDAILPRIGLSKSKVKKILLNIGIDRGRLVEVLVKEGLSAETAEGFSDAIFDSDARSSLK